MARLPLPASAPRRQGGDVAEGLRQPLDAEIRAFFHRHLALALERGEIDRAVVPEAQADALLGTVVAIMSLARAGADASTLANLADAAKRALAPRLGGEAGRGPA